MPKKLIQSPYVFTWANWESNFLKYQAIAAFTTSPTDLTKPPSFKVDQEKNLWVDYGQGNSWVTLIDLVLKMNPTLGIPNAFNQVSRKCGPYFSFHQQIIPLIILKL